MSPARSAASRSTPAAWSSSSSVSLPCPDGDLDAFERAVLGVLGSDLQGPISRQRWQIQGGFEVSPGMDLRRCPGRTYAPGLFRSNRSR